MKRIGLTGGECMGREGVVGGGSGYGSGLDLNVYAWR
jgi:hypothetical protein